MAGKAPGSIDLAELVSDFAVGGDAIICKLSKTFTLNIYDAEAPYSSTNVIVTG